MRYVIGYDFGTLSVRAVLVDAECGREVAKSAVNYEHGVMDVALPSGRRLPSGFALQHPLDYIKSMSLATAEIIKESGISPDEVVGIGVDFTSSTVMPIDSHGMPLCTRDEFSDDEHAYVKLWKHHGATAEAEDIESLARMRGEDWLSVYGGAVSCEWALPKILETLRAAPRVYQAAHSFIEAGDFITLYLTGADVRSLSFAGYKSFYNLPCGYPCNEFYTSLDERMDGFVGGKIPSAAVSVGTRAAVLNSRGRELLGLGEGCAVAVPLIDAHAPMASLNMTRAGDMIMILGTSGCYIVNSDEKKSAEGLWGYVPDSVIPGLYTYEAGQSAFGDALAWFAENCVPHAYIDEARSLGVDIHTLLTEKAERLLPGESGLLSLDWFNGNRSVLSDSNLSGMILGLTLKTSPEEIYRAIIEGVAFGARVIVEQYEKNEIPIRRVAASGGIAGKNPLLMQILSDVLNREISVPEISEAGARGSAIYASVAGGVYTSVTEAAESFAANEAKIYVPCEKSARIYDRLYSEYKAMHDYFGRENPLMHRLRALSEESTLE